MPSKKKKQPNLRDEASTGLKLTFLFGSQLATNGKTLAARLCLVTKQKL